MLRSSGRPRAESRCGPSTLPGSARKILGRRSDPSSAPGLIRSALARAAVRGHSASGLSAIRAQDDAPAHPRVYGGSMRPRGPLERYSVEALALVLALAGQIELWARSGPAPGAVAVVAALIATVPLLLRRRFPFAAPALVFAGLALVSLADPGAVPRGTSFTLFALMLAFWAAGAQ